MTTKPSERIVVFVTPAQKLAISNTAERLGISVSELMRRAVMTFDVTSEQVKVAGIVDRLSAPKAPDALNVALRQVAERAAARDAVAAKLKSRRLAADTPAQPEQAPLANVQAEVPAIAPDSPAVPDAKAPNAAPHSVEIARAANAPAAADAKAVATDSQAVSMKTSVVLNPFNIATFVRP
jgi:hypothetical protein